MSLHIYRATVRGRFADLDDNTRATLLAEAAEHETLVAARFTPAGSFVYDERLQFFSFRFELRETGNDHALEVIAHAEALAVAALDSQGIGFRDLKVTARDMADVWMDEQA